LHPEFDPSLEGDHDPTELARIPDRGRALRVENLKKPVSGIMRTRVGTVSPDARVGEAVALMAAGHYGCVLVIDGSRLVGILSERDVVTRIVDQRKDPGQEVVRDHMTMEPETLSPDDAIAYALNIMKVGGFRHVPIADDTGSVVGIVSIRDAVDLLVEHFRDEILTLPPPTSQGPKTQHGG